MSGVAKAGPSRIPTFGSRLSQPSPKPPSTVEVTKQHIGKRVRFADKEGFLRFIGNVHFSSGVWCGIELTHPTGKNNGTVQGVQYFTSAKNCGLMAPLSKVELVDDICEALNEDSTSGPYSMLFIDADSTFFGDNNNLNRKVSDSLHFNFTKKPLQKESFNVTQVVSCVNETFCKSGNKTKCLEVKEQEDYHDQINLDKDEHFKSSLIFSERKPTDPSKKRLADPEKTLTQSTECLIQDDSYILSSEEASLNSKRRKTFTKLFSTPTRSDVTDHFLKKLRISAIYGAPEKPSSEDDSKRNSLEYDESLGILTPNQMDGITFFNTRSPSLDLGLGELLVKSERKSEVPSPRDESLGLLHEIIEDMSGKHKEEKSTADSFAEPSLGIIDEQLLLNLTLYTDTSNMRIPLDNKPGDILTRIEQTPSPEELPFDPTPIVEITDPKLDTAKSKTNNSFITSITSITSLDTGYQGDGEMSRPASRGAENSPLTRRPVPRPQVRNKPDPMTDSDFYTESDADIQDEHPLRGDRKAQVIDGTLYGVDPQAAADIYVNNRENMDSSGIFTDLDSAKTEEESSTVEIPAPSPSDASTKTISENSQSNLKEILERKSEKNEHKKPASKENPKKRNAPSPGITSPTSFTSPRHGVKEDTVKKYKIPKREISSKVKANLDTIPQQSREKILTKKPVNKWDAVMNKISKNEQSKTNFKNVKSKVFKDIQVVNKIPTTVPLAKPNDVKKTNVRNLPPQKIPTNKTSAMPVNRLPTCSSQIMQPKSRAATPIKRPASAQSTVYNTEKRRIRRNPRQNDYEDISTTSSTSGSSRRPTADPQLVLTANKLPPKVQQNQRQTAQQTKATNTEKVSLLTKDATTLTDESPLIVDALGVVIQHLSYGVVPRMQSSIDISKSEIRKLREHCLQLEKLLNQERQVRATEKEKYKQLEEEYEECKNEMKTAMGHLERILKEETEKHKEAIQNERRHRRSEVRRLLESFNNYLHKGGNSEVCFFEELRQSEASLLDGGKEVDHILLENDRQDLYYCKSLNENLRDRLVETEANVQRRNKEIEAVKKENQKLKQQLQRKESSMKEQSEKFRRKSIEAEHHLQTKLKILEEENSRLRDENGKLINMPEYATDQEERSFQTLAEIKQNEIELLRREIYEANQKLEEMEIYLDKSQILGARVEDLEMQLKRKIEIEQSLIQEKKRLEEILREENNQKRRTQQFNEELQWKLKQNKEVINKILGHEDINFGRSFLGSSFNERHNFPRNNLERSFSLREKNSSMDDDSPMSRKSRTPSDIDWEEIMGPTSPKVKSVVEKSESLSYVLDLDDSPDVVASRIIRRSFRQNTPPKGQFLKSPSNKRSSQRNPLSQSASSNAILSPTSDKCSASTPNSSYRHNHEQIFSWEEDPRYSEHIDQKPSKEGCSREDFSLPPLPSECHGAQHLPAPRLLAHESVHQGEQNGLCSEPDSEEKGKQSSEDEEDESTDM